MIDHIDDDPDWNLTDDEWYALVDSIAEPTKQFSPPAKIAITLYTVARMIVDYGPDNDTARARGTRMGPLLMEQIERWIDKKDSESQ